MAEEIQNLMKKWLELRTNKDNKEKEEIKDNINEKLKKEKPNSYKEWKQLMKQKMLKEEEVEEDINRAQERKIFDP